MSDKASPTAVATAPETDEVPKPSVSVLRKRWNKFKTLKRGYYSLIILTVAYLLSWCLPVLMNSQACLEIIEAMR